MKKITPDEYNKVVDQWREWQSFPWSKLLYDISLFNINRHLDNRKLNILDVGGGNGLNSIHYAKLGHSVTLLDYSSKMLSDAKRSAEKEGVLEVITFCQADAEEIKGIFGAQEFDFIICHLMIEFVSEPIIILRNICELIAPGGLLSILDANRYSEVYRKAIQANDLVAALKVVAGNHRDFLLPGK